MTHLFTHFPCFAFSRSNFIRVYNCTSGELNPVIWKDYGLATLKYARKNPTKYVMLYPNFSYRTNRVIHTFYELFYHFLPAIFFDVLLRFKGTKPFLLKIAKRYKAAADTGNINREMITEGVCCTAWQKPSVIISLNIKQKGEFHSLS